MDIATLTGRFEFYAINHKALKHVPNDKKNTSFVQVDVQDIQISVNNGMKFPAMFFQTPEVEKDGGMDSIVEHYEGSFAILKKIDAQATAASKMNLLYECKLICDQIFNRFLQDSDEFFDGAQIKTSEGSFGPVAGGLMGWGVNFGFEEGYNGEIDPKVWEDLD